MLLTRLDLETREKKNLASYASFSAEARREHSDPSRALGQGDEFRTAFQRDRGRIIHSKAFRRLEGKTQVFVAHYGDHFRNRLTHSLEVAQIGRDLACNFGLNEDLAECIALAHDLGHTPFGHVGEQKLAELLKPFNMSFEHNQQSRRILMILERKYPSFPGLNLTLDLLDGLAKHQSTYDQKETKFIIQPALEAQIIDFADEIAYTNHDIDDGLRAGILQQESLEQFSLWQESVRGVDPKLPTEAFTHRAVSALIDRMTRDLLATTQTNLEQEEIDSLAKVRSAKKKLVSFSEETGQDFNDLKKFLFEKFYLSSSVSERSHAGAQVIEGLFIKLMQNPDKLPREFTERRETDPLHIVVADFIAGMTDSYAEEFLDQIK